MENHDSAKNKMSLDEIRRSAKFHPSIWGDYFLAYDSKTTEITEAEHEELAKQKEMVKKLLARVPNDLTYKMELIDAIQRLGVGYHFEKEIEESLQYIRHNYTQHNSKDNDLRTVALRFRLLRQQGYNIPCDDHFSKFLDNEGNFMESLENDVEGLLSLYEAAHFGTHGEDILDRASEFSSSHLQALIHDQMNNVSLSKLVEEALKMPILKGLTRLSARRFISAYQENESHNEILLNFSKFDFNVVQKMHQRELNDATSWDSDVVLEDWPPHIQMCYKSIIDTYAEIEEEIGKPGESYRVQYAKQELQKLARAYFEEAKWLYNDYVPTVEEYMKWSLESCGYMMMSTSSLMGMGDLVRKQDFDWIINEPLIVRASSVICRLMDDLVGDEYEEKTSSVHCYMKQYGMSKDEACAELRKQVKKAWKDMNQECLEPRLASMPILMRVVNLGRVINLLYADDDCYANPIKSKEWVKMVLVEPLTI